MTQNISIDITILTIIVHKGVTRHFWREYCTNFISSHKKRIVKDITNFICQVWTPKIYIHDKLQNYKLSKKDNI